MSLFYEGSRVQLEMKAEKLQDLMAQGLLCAEDLRCLNSASRDNVKALCLKACSERMGRLSR